MANTLTEAVIDAVRDSALELGLRPLSPATVECVIDYGLEALLECTIAQEQDMVVIDANVRGVLYARSIERVSAFVSRRALAVA